MFHKNNSRIFSKNPRNFSFLHSGINTFTLMANILLSRKEFQISPKISKKFRRKRLCRKKDEIMYNLFLRVLACSTCEKDR